MTRTRNLLGLAAIAAAVVISPSVPAWATGTTLIVADSSGYLPGTATPAAIPAGTDVMLITYQYSFHAIESDERGPNGALLFRSDPTWGGRAEPVTGVAELPPRPQPYTFSCAFWDMEGELVVL